MLLRNAFRGNIRLLSSIEVRHAKNISSAWYTNSFWQVRRLQRISAQAFCFYLFGTGMYDKVWRVVPELESPWGVSPTFYYYSFMCFFSLLHLTYPCSALCRFIYFFITIMKCVVRFFSVLSFLIFFFFLILRSSLNTLHMFAHPSLPLFLFSSIFHSLPYFFTDFTLNYLYFYLLKRKAKKQPKR